MRAVSGIYIASAIEVEGVVALMWEFGEKSVLNGTDKQIIDAHPHGRGEVDHRLQQIIDGYGYPNDVSVVQISHDECLLVGESE